MKGENIVLEAGDLRPVFTRLEALSATFGDNANPDIDSGRLSLRIGRRPLAIPLRTVNKNLRRHASDTYSRVLSTLEYWVIMYSIGIQDTGDWRNIARFGLKVSLSTEQRARVISVFPETQMLKLGGGKASWTGAIGVSGALEADLSPAGLVPNAALSAIIGQVASAGAKMELDTRADVALGLTFSVLSPLVVSTGANDDQASWTFTQAPDRLLRGDQLVGHVIAIPKPAVGMLRLKAELFADLGLLKVFTQRYTGAPLDLEVDLSE